MSQDFKRSRLLVDPEFQTRLLQRMALYLVFFVVMGFHLCFFVEILVNVGREGPRADMGQLYGEFLQRQIPFLFSLVFLAPLFLYDMLKFSNRVAGPLFRCRKVMDDMTAGKHVDEFRPRKHDLMREFFQSFNSLIQAWNGKVEAAGAEHHAEEAKEREDTPRPAVTASGQSHAVNV